MRVGIACVMQESNSFARHLSRLSDFDILHGREILENNRGANTEVGGFVEVLEKAQVEIQLLISAWNAAAGPIEDSAFDSLATLLLEQIGKVECDGLLIALHGAWLGPSYASCDAELIRRVRRAVGPKVPIVVTHDFHANVRPPLLCQIQGLVGYATYPHIDMAETGKKAARLLLAILKNELHPVMYWLPVPLLAPPQIATTEQLPIRDLMERLQSHLPSDLTISASFLCVQPWLDIPEVASSFVVVARGPHPEIPKRMEVLAQWLWDHRHWFHVDWTAPEELLRRVQSAMQRPVIVSEAFDGTSGGSMGDHPGLLSILLPQKDRLSACVFVVDPKAVALATEAGVGATFLGPLGAAFDNRFGGPIMIEGKVRSVSDGRWTLKGPVFTGKQLEMGPTAVVEVGKIMIVVGSRPVPMYDPEIYRSQGVEPREYEVVGVKSPAMYRATYAELGGSALDLDMPGVTRGNLREVPFTRISRPIYPLDEFCWNSSSRTVLITGGKICTEGGA